MSLQSLQILGGKTALVCVFVLFSATAAAQVLIDEDASTPEGKACPEAAARGGDLSASDAWRRGLQIQHGEIDAGNADNSLLALPWFCRAVRAGHARAAYDIGQVFDDGFSIKHGHISTFTHDHRTAFHWYGVAAGEGYTRGWIGQARYLALGSALDSGVQKDPDEAYRTLKKATDEGDTEAIGMLLFVYNGRGPGWLAGVRLPKDFDRARADGYRRILLADFREDWDFCSKARDNMATQLPEGADQHRLTIVPGYRHGMLEQDCVVALGGPTARDTQAQDETMFDQWRWLSTGGAVTAWKFYLVQRPGEEAFDVMRQSAAEAMADQIELMSGLMQLVLPAPGRR